MLGACAVAKRAVADGSEGDVIGPIFARAHPLVAGDTAMGPDDGIGPQILARLAHGAGSIGQVDAVEAQVGAVDVGAEKRAAVAARLLQKAYGLVVTKAGPLAELTAVLADLAEPDAVFERPATTGGDASQ